MSPGASAWPGVSHCNSNYLKVFAADRVSLVNLSVECRPYSVPLEKLQLNFLRRQPRFLKIFSFPSHYFLKIRYYQGTSGLA